MAKSLQEFIDELYNSGQSTANQLHAQRTQADEDFIKQVNEAIDKATASSTKPYQSQIEQLPGQYQKLYDTNAVQELVNRRQVQETMANMGLTDSGLNRTQQTAIALQRGNADSAARLSQQQKTQELQDKIDQIIEISATQKQQQEASVRNNTANWYNELLNNLYNNSVQLGTSRYNAEKQAEAAKAAAETEARARIAEAEARKQAAIYSGVNSGIAGAQAGLNAIGNTGAQFITAGATEATEEFINTYNPLDFGRTSVGQRYNHDFKSYVKDMIARRWNDGSITDADAAYLMDYYGV